MITYVASPVARGWPPAKNRLERFVQLHAAGLVDDRAIADTFVEETVWVDASTLSLAGLSDPVACDTDRIEAGADNVPIPWLSRAPLVVLALRNPLRSA